MTLRVNKNELSWAVPSGLRERAGQSQSPRGASKVIVDTRVANPCSLNLVPPAKKQKPRTCMGGLDHVSWGN